LVDLPIQYRDFASWQREWLQGDVLQKQVDYWKKNNSTALLPFSNCRLIVLVLRYRHSTELAIQ